MAGGVNPYSPKYTVDLGAHAEHGLDEEGTLIPEGVRTSIHQLFDQFTHDHPEIDEKARHAILTLGEFLKDSIASSKKTEVKDSTIKYSTIQERSEKEIKASCTLSKDLTELEDGRIKIAQIELTAGKVKQAFDLYVHPKEDKIDFVEPK